MKTTTTRNMIFSIIATIALFYGTLGLPVKAAVDPPVLQGSGNKTYSVAAPTTTATKIIDGDAGISGVTLVNNGTQTVYIGNSSAVTTANGHPFYPNSVMEFTGVTDALWGITASGTGDIRALVVKGSGGKAHIEKQLLTTANDEAVNTTTVTIATTSTTDAYIIAPFAGNLTRIDFSGIDALAANDTNYITFTVTDLGLAGAGTAVMLAATDANTTKATGGAAIVANGRRSLTLHGTAANLTVAAGDRLRIRAAATGTLANTVTGSLYVVIFTRTV